MGRKRAPKLAESKLAPAFASATWHHAAATGSFLASRTLCQIRSLARGVEKRANSQCCARPRAFSGVCRLSNCEKHLGCKRSLVTEACAALSLCFGLLLFSSIIQLRSVLGFSSLGVRGPSTCKSARSPTLNLARSETSFGYSQASVVSSVQQVLPAMLRSFGRAWRAGHRCPGLSEFPEAAPQDVQWLGGGPLLLALSLLIGANVRSRSPCNRFWASLRCLRVCRANTRTKMTLPAFCLHSCSHRKTKPRSTRLGKFRLQDAKLDGAERRGDIGPALPAAFPAKWHAVRLQGSPLGGRSSVEPPRACD